MTRRIVMFNRVSADGFFAADDGNLDWVVPEPELDKAAARRLSGTGTILFGRRTYDMFESFWPHAFKDGGTASDPHARGRQSPEMRAMADWINAANKIVFSRTRKDVTWRNSRLIRELTSGEVQKLKKEPGSDIMIFGSGSVVSQLTELGLIDEFQFVVAPVFLGHGRRLFEDGPLKNPRPLDVLEATKYPSGNVMLRYGTNAA